MLRWLPHLKRYKVVCTLYTTSRFNPVGEAAFARVPRSGPACLCSDGALGCLLALHGTSWHFSTCDHAVPARSGLSQVAALLHALSNKLTQQEEALAPNGTVLWTYRPLTGRSQLAEALKNPAEILQALHQSVTSVITFFLGLARKQELLKKRVEEFEVNYNGEVEDCEKDFEETCERNEKTMQDLHGAIDDAAHHETLDELKQQTFDHLDQMALGYRDHADQMLQIHNRYPGEAQDLIRRETRGYCKDCRC